MDVILLNFHVIAVKQHTTNGDQYVCGQTVKVKENCLFMYTGVRARPGMVKILEPMSHQLNYFEYQIISGGKEHEVGIGVGDEDYSLDRMPGWDVSGVGYHADDGKLYKEEPYPGAKFGPTCTDNDTMGCGVDFESEDPEGCVDVFFTKNNRQIGGYVKLKKPASGLYPLIGLHSEGGKVRYSGRMFYPIHLLKASYYT